MYNEVFQDGPLPWAACSNAWSPFQWRNVPLISNLKDPLVHLEAIFPGPESFTLGGEYLINVYKYLKEHVKEARLGSLQWSPLSGLLNIRTNSFTVRVTEHCYNLPRKVVKSHLWRYSKATWTLSSANCLKVSLSRVVRAGDLPRSTQTCYDSVSVWSEQLFLGSSKSKIQRRN